MKPEQVKVAGETGVFAATDSGRLWTGRPAQHGSARHYLCGSPITPLPVQTVEEHLKGARNQMPWGADWQAAFLAAIIKHRGDGPTRWGEAGRIEKGVNAILTKKKYRLKPGQKEPTPYRAASRPQIAKALKTFGIL